jgi:hypothetical protein
MRWRSTEISIPMDYVHIQTLDKSKGDVLNVRQGNVWIDMLDGTHTEGINGDYHLDQEMGIIYLYRPMFSAVQVQVQFRYGYETVPYDIKRACTDLVSADILESDFQTVIISEGQGAQTDRYKTSQRWRDEAAELLSRHRRGCITQGL